jgi:hypothetical protein
VILGPSSGGAQFGGAAPDQMIGEVIVGGIAHEWGHRRIFPKEHAKGASMVAQTLPLPKSYAFSFRGLGGCPAEQVARDVDQREPSSFFGQFGGVGLYEYFDGFSAQPSKSTS